MSKKKAYVETYGCQMNISDGELMSGILASEGYDLVSDPAEADVVLVNTCAIREHAEQRVLGRVAQLNGLKARKPDLILGVTGCMAQRMGEDLLRQASYVDLVMGPDEYRRLPETIADLSNGSGSTPGAELVQLKGPRKRIPRTLLTLDPSENYEDLEVSRASRVSAWIPIQRGCNHRCTFCIVPYVRGPEKNRDPEAVLREVEDVGSRGVTEVTLLGQTVNSYRWGEWTFHGLLEAVARTPGIRRVRFTSPHPNDVTRELVEVMASEEAVCESLHLPMQAGNDRTLKRMLRRHSVEAFMEKVELVRKAVPDVALSTDVIVAFPGETREEFEDTLHLLRRIRFDEAFTYKYSPREGTPATRFAPGEFVVEEEARRRLDELIRVTREIQSEINRDELGRVEEVLVEKTGREPGFLLGKTRRNKVVVFPGQEELIGSYVTVRLDQTTGATFSGTLAVDAAVGESR